MSKYLTKKKPKRLYKPFGLSKSGTTALRPSGLGEPRSIASEETPLPVSGFPALQTNKTNAKREDAISSIDQVSKETPAVGEFSALTLDKIKELGKPPSGGNPAHSEVFGSRKAHLYSQLKYTPKKPNLQAKRRGEND